jgi:hypothetical protein
VSRAVFILARPIDRERAAMLCFQAEPFSVLELRDPARSQKQNANLWRMLTQVSKQLVWHGQRYSPEAWKDWFMHRVFGAVWMPDENGGMIPVGRSTSALKVDEHRKLTDLIEAFAARHGVEL